MSEERAKCGGVGSLHLVLDLPVSKNRAHRVWGGRVVLTPAARAYRESVAWELRRQALPARVALPPKSRWTIAAVFHIPDWTMDMGNFIDELSDALAPALGLDDRYLVRALFKRAENDPETPRVDVVISWW